MKTKVCGKCGRELSIGEFYKDKTKKDGHHSICKTCTLIIKKKYYKVNKRDILEKREIYYRMNKEKILNYFRDYVKKNKDTLKELWKEYYYKHKEEIDKQSKIYYERNKEELLRKRGEWATTKEGKIARARAQHKRNRNLKFIPLFINPFPEEVKVHYHHINNIFVIPIPASIHMKTLGGKHKEKCKEWIMKLYGLDLDIIMKERMYKEVSENGKT